MRNEVIKAAKLLERHNRWRRGEGIPMVDVEELGKAIDLIVEFAISHADDEGILRGIQQRFGGNYPISDYIYLIEKENENND